VVGVQPRCRGHRAAGLPGAGHRPGALHFRRTLPRFQPENLDGNLAAVDTVRRIAAAHEATPGQVALAWLLAQGPDVVPIPGTKRVPYLEENARAVALTLSAGELAELAALRASGDRYPDMNWVERDTAARAGV